MARMVLMKIITIALAVYIICLSDFFLSPEGDIINLLMVACINQNLSHELTNPASLLGFMNVTSSINCSQNGSQRRMTEIKVSLNQSINERNRGHFVCPNATPNFIASGWFICETHTKENHFLNQKSFLQVSKMVITMTDRSKITGINGQRIQLLHFPHRMNASWSYSTPKGMETTKCYMDIQFHNSTVENLLDQTSGPCAERNCSNAVKWHTAHDLCHKNTTNYFSMSNPDMNTNMVDPLPEEINVVWNIHTPGRMQSTKCITHIKLQRSATENQEHNCVLEIIWLAVFPAFCIILLIIMSYQWFKKDLSCHGESNYQETSMELSISLEHENIPFHGEDSSGPQGSKKPSDHEIDLIHNKGPSPSSV